MSYKIIRAFRAREDLKSIARYTRQTWGNLQVQRYMMAIETTIAKLQISPAKQGKDRSDALTGLRSIAHADQYFIFYRVKNNSVEILRVLHQRRDWQKFFG